MRVGIVFAYGDRIDTSGMVAQLFQGGRNNYSVVDGQEQEKGHTAVARFALSKEGPEMRKDKDNSDNGNILHPRGDDDDVVSTGSRSSKTRGSQQLSKLVSGEKKGQLVLWHQAAHSNGHRTPAQDSTGSANQHFSPPGLREARGLGCKKSAADGDRVEEGRMCGSHNSGHWSIFSGEYTGDNNECPDVLLSRPASRRSGCSLKGATMNRPQHRLQANPEAVRKVTGPVDKKVFVPCQAARAHTTGRPRGPSNN
ncbi:hypothetical protein C8Q69DRAFT_444652 [Paecilomyces variotii]|uniref:Uncharacterized protein n=1 Tax=Byssochlamys spectabilis TaxID=264951 RepID=A0A443HVA1_BYSSP|nr:hypothetical protein C8Q69DRAFT_444652 [Paecilomyces variotii]RWQ95756.1 hypothetical protein C8Q69DRAFT_444652 [Paecilomyces variotii]